VKIKACAAVVASLVSGALCRIIVALTAWVVSSYDGLLVN
jgi:hypothetical protein